MSIPAKRISKVVIAGEWYTVALGSFEVIEMEFTDDRGDPIHDEPLEFPAYHFKTLNKDEYYGPLTAIELFKLIDV
jgi:hypothetical protein